LTNFGSQKQLLSNEDKIGLISDASSLSISGHGHTSSFLALVENFKDEENYLVWQSIIQALGNIRSIFGDIEDVSNGYVSLPASSSLLLPTRLASSLLQAKTI